MNKYLFNTIIAIAVGIFGFQIVILGASVKHLEDRYKILNTFFQKEQIPDLKDNAPLSVYVQPSLPKVVVETVDRDELLYQLQVERYEKENFFWEYLLDTNYILSLYPEREKGDSQRKEKVCVTAENAFKCLITPEFYDPHALKNVEQRVVDAKAHLSDLFESGKYVRLLSPVEILAIACRETCEDDEKALISLNCLGDLGMSGYEKAHGPLQISQRAYKSVDAIKGFGLIGPDFHGDLALSEMVFQAWIFEHCTGDDFKKVSQGNDFEWFARCWNAGPSGALKYKRAYGYFHGDNRRGVKQYLDDIVMKLPSVTEYLEDQKNLDVVSANREKVFGVSKLYSSSGGERFQLPTWNEEDEGNIASNP